ncbi:flavodoxin [Paratractidigestivibacter sp.]|uniref:flavodoxin n=1 Tax=Paratractidigestivibacter sp. TaxID=2847316 RepID=UPI002ABD513E|nr:flavodoxin [Paratractidigestivibacter sp.]
MSKIAVVYWTGSGNTEAMANAIVDGAAAAGADAKAVLVSEFSADDVAAFDALAFGCPAMGAEELESDEFEPVWEACKEVLGDKPVALFGSYGWGSGEWMDTWKDDAESAGVKVIDALIANDAPDDEATSACEALGKSLAEA